MTNGPVRPDETDDPVGAVLDAHLTGRDLALLTSGTTGGVPRRVIRSTASWWDSFPAYRNASRVVAGARLWLPGPLTSTLTLFAAVHAAWAGARRVSSPTEATHACLTPSQLLRYADDLAPGATVTVAGARLDESLAERTRSIGIRLWQYYGAAELSFVACGGDSERAEGTELRAFPGVEIELRTDPRPGTIWARSPYLCTGYDEADPRVGAGSLVRDDNGWASVGDVGRIDDGVLTVLGRPDAIITAGVTVLVSDVEAVLTPAARAPFAVHGLTHPTLGEVIAVVVTDAADRAPMEERAQELLPRTHHPRVWRVVDELPLTPGGKVDRAALTRVLDDAPAVGVRQ